MNSDPRGLLKARAESFAHHLQTRLKRLSESEDATTWSEVKDAEVYYDIDSSLASPQEEVKEPVYIAAQNRDSLPIQRTDSEVSTYFDAFQSVEELEPLSTMNLQKTPLRLLNLKTDIPPTITSGQASFFVDEANLKNNYSESSPSQLPTEIEVCNGHLECLDELENNGGLEMPSLRLELEIVENETENCCDIIGSVVEENSKAVGDVEELAEFKLSLDNNCDVTLVEVDTGQVIAEIAMDVPSVVATDNGSCVFCDIEQIKTSLTNGWTEHTTLPEISSSVSNGTLHKSIRNSGEKSSDEGNLCKDGGRSSEESKYTNLENNQTKVDEESPTPVDKSKGELSDSEESVPLTDLLQVLKNEITNETSKKNDNLKTDPSKTIEGPSIEVTESSPVDEANLDTAVDEEFDIETRRKNFRRSSSLKSGKTPPGTPYRKKIVRFADVLGLDLADVKTFLDEVPTVPMSAFQDLHGIDMSSDSAAESPSNKITIVIPQIEKVLVPLFQQPCVQPNFLDRVRVNNVCLENAIVSDMSLFAISGVVRVKNIDFHKSVYVRYSINNWHSFSDLQARYVPNSCDGFSDKFTFVLYAHTLNLGQTLQFAVRFHTAGAQFWDSNGGLNYTFVCNSIDQSKPLMTFPSTSSSSSSDETAAFW